MPLFVVVVLAVYGVTLGVAALGFLIAALLDRVWPSRRGRHDEHPHTERRQHDRTPPHGYPTAV